MATSEAQKAAYKRWYERNKKTAIATTEAWRHKSGYYRNNPKLRARNYLRDAVRTGAVKRLPCERRGAMPTHGHHTD